MDSTGKAYLSPEEARAQLSCLSKAELVRLERIAHYQALKLKDGDAEDLFAEGLSRILGGERRWPRGLPLSRFFTGVLKSIVSSRAKHARVASVVEVDAEVDTGGQVDGEQHDIAAHSAVDPAHVAHTHELLNILMNECGQGDPNVLAVMMALGEGETAIEAQHRFGLSAQQYDAARKRLRRCVDQIRRGENS